MTHGEVTITALERATHIERVADHTFQGCVTREWWGQRGPHGGVMAALNLRALRECVRRVEMSPISLTVCFLEPPQEGDIRLTATVERSGTSMAVASARAAQDGRTVMTAIGTFGRPRPGHHLDHLPMPAVASPEVCEPWPFAPWDHVEVHDRLQWRWGFGPPPLSGEDVAVTGGWMRFTEPVPVREEALAVYSDAWPPSILSTVAEPHLVPTIEMTIYFRRPVGELRLDPLDYLLARVTTRLSLGGFAEEECELWAPTGELVAQARQLRLVRPATP